MSAYLVHVANLLILTSFLVRDILWLRALSIGAGLCFVPYFYAQAEPLWAPIGWNLLFMSVNAVQIYRLYLERRPVHLGPDEAALYRLALRSLTEREAQLLLREGTWERVEAEGYLCRSGEPLGRLIVLLEGGVRVESAGTELARLEPGRLVGEMSYLTGEAPSVDVRAAEPCRFLAWETQALKTQLAARPELRSAFQGILGADLSRKLRASQRLDELE